MTFDAFLTWAARMIPDGLLVLIVLSSIALAALALIGWIGLWLIASVERLFDHRDPPPK